MKKLKETKPVRWMVRKKYVAKVILRADFKDTHMGAMTASVLAGGFILAGYVKELLPVLPLPLCFVITPLVLLLINEVFGLLIKILFGFKKRNRIYGLTCFLALTVAGIVVPAAGQILVHALFSLVVTLLVCLFGRALYAVLKKKRRTLLLAWSLAVPIVFLGYICLFMASKGFPDYYIAGYLQMAAVTRGVTQKEAVPGNVTSGDYQPALYTYGTDSARDIASHTYDLSKFAEQGLFDKLSRRPVLGYALNDAPIEGRIWYPKGQKNCPVMFIIHGNHQYTEESYLGYDYLGEYLASFGYVVVSVNENACNSLSEENDARAVLLLENMKFVLEKNKEETSPIYQLIDETQIAIAGHSRGGEAVCEAYLFNDYACYPEDGTVKFDYHFPISSIVAIAPCVDQYRPAQHTVALTDVNYFMIHGANDQDVTMTCGQKQYHNITFSGKGDYIKSALYVAGANHGQFNTVWGKYDLSYPTKQVLNVANLMPESEQQRVLQIFVKIFLDVTLRHDRTNEALLKDYSRYAASLPATIYQQLYQTSRFTCLADFEQDADLASASVPGAALEAVNVSAWTEERMKFGSDSMDENFVMKLSWENTKEAAVVLNLPAQDFTDKKLVFDLADAREQKGATCPDGIVTIYDKNGNQAAAAIHVAAAVYPALPVQLLKFDYLFEQYECKHQFQNVSLSSDVFLAANADVDLSCITKITIAFDYSENGSVMLDNIGLED